MTSITSVTWNDLLRNTSQNFLDRKISEFRRTTFQIYLAKYSNNNEIAAKCILSALLIMTAIMHHLFSFFFPFSSLPYLFFSFSCLIISEIMLSYYSSYYLPINYEWLLMLTCLFVCLIVNVFVYRFVNRQGIVLFQQKCC